MKAVYIALTVLVVLCSFSAIVGILFRVLHASNASPKSAKRNEISPVAAPRTPTPQAPSPIPPNVFELERDALIKKVDDAIANTGYTCAYHDVSTVQIALIHARAALDGVTDQISLDREKSNIIDKALEQYELCKSNPAVVATTTVQPNPNSNAGTEFSTDSEPENTSAEQNLTIELSKQLAELQELIQWCKAHKSDIPFLAEIETDLEKYTNSTTTFTHTPSFKYARQVKEYVDKQLIAFKSPSFDTQVDAALRGMQSMANPSSEMVEFKSGFAHLVDIYKAGTHSFPKFYIQLWLNIGAKLATMFKSVHSIPEYVYDSDQESTELIRALWSDCPSDFEVVRHMLYEGAIRLHLANLITYFRKRSLDFESVHVVAANMVIDKFGSFTAEDFQFFRHPEFHVYFTAFRQIIKNRIKQIVDTNLKLLEQILSVFKSKAYLMDDTLYIAAHAAKNKKMPEYDALMAYYMLFSPPDIPEPIPFVALNLLKANETTRMKDLLKVAISKLGFNSGNAWEFFDYLTEDENLHLLDDFLDAMPEFVYKDVLLNGYIESFVYNTCMVLWMKLASYLDADPKFYRLSIARMVTTAIKTCLKYGRLALLELVLEYAKTHNTTLPQESIDLLKTNGISY